MLARVAAAGGTVTYGELMRKYRVPRGRRLSMLIGELDRREYAKGAPGFAAIIVRKDTGLPGGGFFCDTGLPPTLRRGTEGRSNPRLSPEERAYVKDQQKKIWDYYEVHDSKSRGKSAPGGPTAMRSTGFFSG